MGNISIHHFLAMLPKKGVIQDARKEGRKEGREAGKKEGRSECGKEASSGDVYF